MISMSKSSENHILKIYDFFYPVSLHSLKSSIVLSAQKHKHIQMLHKHFYTDINDDPVKKKQTRTYELIQSF